MEKKFNNKKFRNNVINFLMKKPRHFGDISHIVNKYIHGDIKLKLEVQHELVYLRRREIIVIEDIPDDPMKLQDDWWGNFLGHNPTAGYKVEGLQAMLGNKYLDISWYDRHPILWEIIKRTYPF